MVWACSAGGRESPLIILDGNCDARKYTKTLQDHLLIFTEDLSVE